MEEGDERVVSAAADLSEAEATARMAAEVRDGLLSSLPTLPSKYFYDDRGCALFDEITRLPEYYPTRTETAILERHADEIVDLVAPRELVELGSGSGRKTRLLLDAMERGGTLRRCVLLDVNRAALEASVEALVDDYPGLDARGVQGDFLRDVPSLGRGGGRLVAFLAGTIGNLPPDDVPAFLASVASILAPGDGFLLGVDLVKPVERLEAAYDDSLGVTAEFNRNVLAVVNRRLDGDFVPAEWEHVAFWDPERSWIEMRLRASRACRVRVRRAGLDLTFPAGAEIRTEISAKYTRESLARRLEGTGLRLHRWFTDDEALFADALLEPVPA
jgi:L-histidine N-alpha-methyltransferase